MKLGTSLSYTCTVSITKIGDKSLHQYYSQCVLYFYKRNAVQCCRQLSIFARILEIEYL